MRPRAEIVLVKAPRERAVVDGAAARLVAVVQDWERVRAHTGVRPPGDGHALRVRAQFLPLEVAQFIVRAEIRGLQTRAALQANDFHACLAEFGCEDPACRAHSDDDYISLFDCHGLSLPHWV